MNDHLHNKPDLWFIKSKGKVTDPFPVKLIGSYLVLGRIDLDTPVSIDQEKWIPISRLPSLIPDEVRLSHTVEGRAGLEQARSREDERRSDTRREQANRRDKERAESDRREAADRRQNNEKVSKSYMKLRADLSANRIKAKKIRLFSLVVLFLVVISLMVSFLFVEPVGITESVDCSSKAAPNVDWHSCNKNSIDLVSKSLQKSNLHSIHLNSALLINTNFTEANLSYASLQNANLSNAILKGALLVGANLNNANLSYADLSGVDLSYADLRNAVLSNTQVLNTKLDNAIWLDGRRCAKQSIDKCVFAE